MEFNQNIILIGDLNEVLLNENYHYVRDILLSNSLQNVINVPTRETALLDPIIISDYLVTHDSGVMVNPNHISDHHATYVILPHNYSTYIYSQSMVV